MTIATPIWGKLSDLFDKKILAQLSIVMFVAGSGATGLSTSITMMMTARAVQGVAMGGLMTIPMIVAQKLGTTQAAAFGSPGETELDISGLSAPLRQLFHNAYADAFGPVFLIAALISAVTVLAVAVVRGTPLRTTIGMRPVSQSE